MVNYLRNPRAPAVALAALLLGVTGPSVAGAGADASTGDSPASRPGIQKRVPWTTSRLTGAPEPPPPYRIERAFPGLQFSEPVELVSAPGSDRLFVIQLKGSIVSFPDRSDGTNADLFLDLKELHPDVSNVYGLAFHPGFATNRLVFVCYVLKDDDPVGSRVSRFRVNNSTPPRVDPQSEQVLITWLGGGHNGGSIHFGPDGFLYISTGDGKGPDPPDVLDTGQDIGDLLSSILRIDVDHEEGDRAYRVPTDNPFVQTPGARPEVWCYGLRNPWRMSFDRETGDLWVGDVGWELWEMIHRVRRGANYGWSVVEGKQVVKPNGRRGPSPIVPPVVMHSHAEAASITGGYVYHGERLHDLRGAYIYGDYETGRIWGLRQKDGEVTWQQELAHVPIKLSSFGVDRAGELYLVDHIGGGIHRLVPNEAARTSSTFPTRLSETGLFADVAAHRVAPGVISFSVNAEIWNDGGIAERFIALPGDSTIVTTNAPWQYPKDAVLARTISLELDPGRPASRRRIETQLLHFDGLSWGAYSYRWNDQQTDADLVGKSGAETVLQVHDASAPEGRRQQTWKFQSRGECLRCHNPWCGTALGFFPAQLNRKQSSGSDRASSSGGSGSVVDASQLRTLAQVGIFDRDLSADHPSRLANPHDQSASLEDRARAYLHVNCSHCHREHAGGSVMVFMNHDLPLEKTSLIDSRPAQGTFGMTGARVVAPGDPCRSVLYYRFSKLGNGHMPYLGTTSVDVKGAALLYDWIKSLPPRSFADSREQQAVAKSRNEEAQSVQRLASLGSGDDPDCAASIDQLLRSVSGALALLRAVDDNSIGANLKPVVLAKATGHSDPLVRDLYQRFVPEERRARLLGTDIKPESILSLTGDALRGRLLFFQEGGPNCFTCHRVEGQGRDFGPDLSQVGRKYSRAQILENILEPSKTIDPNFVATVVETRQDISYTGFVIRKTPGELVLKTATADRITIPAGDVSRTETQRLSLMPEQLLQSLTAQQAADLIEFLQSLR